MGGAADLRIRLLGGLDVEGFDRRDLGSRKARQFLKRLALARGGAVGVDALVDTLWPDGDPADGQIPVLASRLRSVLGQDRILRTDNGYRLVADWIDVAAFEALAAEARSRHGRGDTAGAYGAAVQALALAAGSLLPGDEADWIETERRSLAHTVRETARVAAESGLGIGDWAGAVGAAQRVLDTDPYDETALRLLMEAHMSAGRPSSALAAYAAARARLAEDLGVSPGPQTEALHDAILLGSPDVDRAAPAASAAPAVSLPGRASEICALDAALDRTAVDGVTFAAVEGEAGIGKTRLVTEWAAAAAARGVTVLSGRCDDLERALPLQVVADALTGYVATLSPEGATALLGSAAATLAPLLGSGQASEAVLVPSLQSAITGKTVLFGCLLDVFRRIASRGPTALVLDDVHRAGETTREWLQFLARYGRRAMLLVVLAQRDDRPPAHPARPVLRLGPLDIAATAAVVGPERAADLHARTGGNPLFLVALAESGDQERLPASLREAVAMRCELTGEAAPTLRTAAVIGREIDFDVLMAVTGTPPAKLLDHLDRGVRARLLVERGGDYMFAHDLVQAALDATAGDARRSLVHRAAAHYVAGRPDADPLRVAHHARLGNDFVLAASALAQASQRAAERADLAQAEGLLDEALALHDSDDVRLARARIRLVLQRYEEAASDSDRALERGAGAAALEVTGWSDYFRHKFGAARRLADDGARMAGDDLVKASCLLLGGRARHATGDLEGAEERLVRAVDLTQGSPLSTPPIWLGELRAHQGRLDEALEMMEWATRPGALPHQPYAVMHAMTFANYVHALRGDVSAALIGFDRMVELTDRYGLSRYRGLPENFRGWILRGLGQHRAADDANGAAFDLGTSVRRLETILAAHLDLADGHIQRGELGAAADAVDRAAAILARDEEIVFGWRQQLKHDLFRGWLALAAHDSAAAGGAAAGVLEVARARGLPRYEDQAYLLLARARAARGEHVDLDDVDVVVRRLPRTAGPDAWWTVAEVSRDLRVAAWWRLGAEFAERLARGAGGWADAFRSAADARLDALRP